MYNNNENIEKLYIKGSTRFQEVNFNQPRLYQPKLNIIKLKGFQQLVDLIKQQEVNSKQIPNPQIITSQLLPQPLMYPPKHELMSASKREISLRKSSEQRIQGKKSFTDSAEPHSLERRQVYTKLNKFAIKKTVPIKVEEQSFLEPAPEFSQLITYTNLLMVIPQEKISYKAFVTKGNNGMLMRQLVKSRTWWMLLESPSNDMNLYWTQLRKQGFYEDLIQFSGQQSSFTKSQKKQVLDKLKYKLEDDKYTTFASSNLLRVHNHLECNFQISNKKALFYNMKNYYLSKNQDPFQFIPLTFHIQDGIKDPVYMQFEDYARKNNQHVWIVKPGEESNRGNGIEVANSINQVKRLVQYRELHSNGVKKTFIVQQYISKPLLYNKRKFDLRCYMLITCINHQFKAYWYQEGYIRTSCKEFNLDDVDCKYIHLTNDAVQKYSKYYGKYESANKVSFSDFSRYLADNYNWNFNTTIDQLKNLTTDIVKATYQHLDPNRHFYTFELFGLDFMIDSDFHPWLIEVNTNPCLETGCPLLSRLITHLVENTIRIAIDPMYPPPTKKKPLPDFKNNFELIFFTPQIEQRDIQPEIQQDDDNLDVDDDN